MWATLGVPTPDCDNSWGPAIPGKAGVMGGHFRNGLLSEWWLETPRRFICSVWIGGNLCTTAGDVGKGASLNLQPSVNGAIDYVVA